jgi:DNA-binding MarR family transcriptional regulator
MGQRTNDAETLRALVQQFVRGFGLLDDATTPCGQPMHTSHAHALMVLLRAGEDGLHQAALARSLGIDKSNASRLVRQLAGKRQLEIVPSKEDARLKRVRLTEKGARVAATVDDASRRRFDALLAAIAPGRRRAVLDALDELNRAIARETERNR